MFVDQITTRFASIRTVALVAGGSMAVAAGCVLLFAVAARLVFAHSTIGAATALAVGFLLLFRGWVALLRGGCGVVLLASGDTS